MSSLPRKVGKKSQYSESFKRDAVRLSTERSLLASRLSGWSAYHTETGLLAKIW